MLDQHLIREFKQDRSGIMGPESRLRLYPSEVAAITAHVRMDSAESSMIHIVEMTAAVFLLMTSSLKYLVLSHHLHLLVFDVVGS